jgi:phage gp36-like protein
MTTPAPTLYASIDDLRLVLDSTDAGTGTGAQLSDEQLTLALQAATDRVTLYAGYSWQTGDEPSIIQDLTLDLGSWWATTYYLKQKDMGPNNPVQLRYTEAMKILEALRKGEINLSATAVTPGDDITGSESHGQVFNSLPSIFTGDDSVTRIVGDQLVNDVPPDMVSRRMIIPDGWWG